MRDPDAGDRHAAHTTNPVPIFFISEQPATLKDGRLGDIASTLLDLMGLPRPAEMTGHSLLLLPQGQGAPRRRAFLATWIRFSAQRGKRAVLMTSGPAVESFEIGIVGRSIGIPFCAKVLQEARCPAFSILTLHSSTNENARQDRRALAISATEQLVGQQSVGEQQVIQLAIREFAEAEIWSDLRKDVGYEHRIPLARPSQRQLRSVMCDAAYTGRVAFRGVVITWPSYALRVYNP